MNVTSSSRPPKILGYYYITLFWLSDKTCFETRQHSAQNGKTSSGNLSPRNEGQCRSVVPIYVHRTEDGPRTDMIFHNQQSQKQLLSSHVVHGNEFRYGQNSWVIVVMNIVWLQTSDTEKLPELTNSYRVIIFTQQVSRFRVNIIKLYHRDLFLYGVY